MMPKLPEPNFKLIWRGGQYWVSKPNIDGTDVYSPETVLAIQEEAYKAGMAAERDRYIEELIVGRDALLRALEIIAVGDAENPQAQAAEELIALGYWRDIPEVK